MAAPVGGEVLQEVLQYLELQKDKEEQVEEGKEKVMEVTVPELRGTTIKEAKEILKELKMKLEINNLEEIELNESETIIKEQLPKPGIVVNNTNKIYVDVN